MRSLQFALPFIVCLAALASEASAQGFVDSRYGAPRQYYGTWKKPPVGDFFYREYYYKPRREFAGYKHHYVVHYPSRPKHNYYFNPYTRKFWGRCPSELGPEPTYQKLPPEWQKEQLSEIPESAFPPPGALPPLPDSSDGVTLDLPPDDLPGALAPPRA